MRSQWFSQATLILSTGLVGFSFSSAAIAEPGVTDTEIRVGSTGGKSGDDGAHGRAMAEGAQIYYDSVNATGGVNGRKIVFISKDDGYEPARAAENARQLIEKEKVFALVGGNGTPAAQAVMPLVEQSGTPFLFTFSGGNIMFPNPPKKNIFQVRINYAEEATSLVNYVLSQGIKEVGIFYQDDAFGTSGRSGAEKALAEHKLKLVGIGTHKRNTLEVEKAVDDLKRANPKAVYIQATTLPAITFIKKCLEKDFRPLFIGPSALSSIQMRDALQGVPVEMYLSEVVPSPLDMSLPLIKNFRKQMEADGKKVTPDFVMLEGYIGAVLFTEAAKRAGKNLTREGLEKALEQMSDYDLGGVKVSFGPKKHFGMDRNFIFHLKGGQLSEVK